MVPPQGLLKELQDLEDTQEFKEAEEKRRQKEKKLAAAKAKLQEVAAKINRSNGKRKARAAARSDFEPGEERKAWNQVQRQAKQIDELIVGQCRTTTVTPIHAYSPVHLSLDITHIEQCFML